MIPASKCRAKGGPGTCRYHSASVMGGLAARIKSLEDAIASYDGDAEGLEKLEDELEHRIAQQKKLRREVDSRKLHESLHRGLAKMVSEGTGDVPRRPSSVSLLDWDVPVVAGHRLPDSTRRVLKAAGYGCPDMLEIDAKSGGAEAFHDLMEMTRTGRFASSVWVYDEEDYRKMRLFTGRYGECGYALKEGDSGELEIVSVFSMPKKNLSAISKITDEDMEGIESRVSQSMLLSAIANGGRILDCFDTVLPQLYASVGFKEYDRASWDEEQKPAGWDYETYADYNGGRPDVVFMRWDGEAWSRPGETDPSEYDDILEECK